ncbi:hypothetical protein GQ43DRAFT_476273 [Delitschia confertaspora ATCC 74209]|uniref:Rhodopsin domain-containing protein n=1 Tax=Delitschia confertaspora ATCC 74209 TaxID=1513339 RepID=A0A9P4JBM2_9PLEO|nr:hypothetical protein GQ43DRAFT_476273 [Delitschia confertaspora ATCC 74209]
MKYLPSGFVVFLVGVTLTSFSTVIVALRYYCRYFLMGSMGLSDHFMLAALLMTWGNTVINYYQYQTSRAFHPSQFRFPDRREHIKTALFGTLITWWIYRITYIISLTLAKLSILFFYRAIASRTNFRRIVHGTIIFLTLSTLAITIGNIFQCEHPPDAWSTAQFFSQFEKPGERGKNGRRVGKCYSPTTLYVISAAVNLFTDVVILLLPIPTLLSLRVPISKRLALVAIFSVGIMAIVASCVRMWIMALWAESLGNNSKFGADLLLWGQVEVNAGITSASVPFLRLLFRKRRDRKEKMVSDKEKLVGGAPHQGPQQPGRLVVPDHQRTCSENKPLELNSLQFFDFGGVGGHADTDDPEKESRSPIWKPFITVPASLSSSHRDSSGSVTMVDVQGARVNRSRTPTARIRSESHIVTV